MTQKIVIEVQVRIHKHRAKAMEIASVTDGVTSIEISGEGKDKVVVIGERVDAVKLTRSIRKKVNRNARLLLVEEVKPKDDQKTQSPSVPVPQCCNYYPPQYYPPPVYSYETVYNPNPPCSIL